MSGGQRSILACPRKDGTHLQVRIDDQDALRSGLRLHDENLKRQAVVADLDNVVLGKA